MFVVCIPDPAFASCGVFCGAFTAHFSFLVSALNLGHFSILCPPLRTEEPCHPTTVKKHAHSQREQKRGQQKGQKKTPTVKGKTLTHSQRETLSKNGARSNKTQRQKIQIPVSCSVIACYAMSQHLLSCHVMSCHVEPCLLVRFLRTGRLLSCPITSGVSPRARRAASCHVL